MANDRLDPRAAGVLSLRHFMELPGDDAEAKADRKLLRRLDLDQAVRK
jgi:hypothetical protein